MSTLFGGTPSYAPPKQYQAKDADQAAQNAGLFERLQRSWAYGPQQTRLAGTTPGQGRAGSWEAWARDSTISPARTTKAPALPVTGSMGIW